MDYGKAFGFVTKNPKWLNQVGIGCVCYLVPIVGPMVWEGYLYRAVEQLHRGREGYGDFDPNRFMPYLKRGLWWFVIQMVLGVVFAGMLVLYFLVTGGAFSLGGEVIGTVVAVAGGLLVFVLLGVMMAVATPLGLYAGLRQSLDWQGGWTFTRDFIGRVGESLVVSTLVLLGASFVLGFVGSAACCVGIYPATVWWSFAQHHLAYQLYERYLQRGGAELALPVEKDEDRGDGEVLDVTPA